MIFAALKSAKSGGPTCIGWVLQFTLQSAQRQRQISKIFDIFEKSVHKLRVPPLVDPRAVEIDIFVDFTISKEAKMKSDGRTVDLPQPPPAHLGKMSR